MHKVSKYTDEYINQICEEKDLQFIRTYKDCDNKGKSRKYIEFICNKHIDKCVQKIICDKIDKIKKPCKYCNHSYLKITFKDEMFKINPNIEILSEYKNWDTPIHCRCRIHGNEWDGKVSVLLYGGGCNICAGIKRWDSRGRVTTESAGIKLSNKYPHILLIGDYNGGHSDTTFKCQIHNVTWNSTYSRVLFGECGCPECGIESIRRSCALSDTEFLNRISTDYPHITTLDNYINRETEMAFLCTIHNQSFRIKPKYLLAHKIKGCNICCQSLGEAKMCDILNNLGYSFKKQYVFKDCVYEKPLRFDAYDSKNNVAYEYQGEQHYEPICFNGMSKDDSVVEFEKNKQRDEVKREYCIKNNIRLIEIPYWEFDNMEKYIIKQLNNK